MSDWKAVRELKVAEIADKLTTKFEVEYLSAAFDPKHSSIVVGTAGAKCTEVVSSQYFAAASGVWHSDCGDAQNFSIVIDDIGSTSVRPIPYEDAVPVLSTELQ